MFEIKLKSFTDQCFLRIKKKYLKIRHLLFSLPHPLSFILSHSLTQYFSLIIFVCVCACVCSILMFLLLSFIPFFLSSPSSLLISLSLPLPHPDSPLSPLHILFIILFYVYMYRCACVLKYVHVLPYILKSQLYKEHLWPYERHLFTLPATISTMVYWYAQEKMKDTTTVNAE